jgi:hypothetical protein
MQIGRRFGRLGDEEGGFWKTSVGDFGGRREGKFEMI